MPFAVPPSPETATLPPATAMPQPVLLVPKRAGRRATVAIARHGTPDRDGGASA
ncbi:hypothetical protein [Frankia casuarinae]|uniref:hypothetical protein n=1 Tax=Frankia casuarinae (strain DSM 45818 / CECT 9043 / HFP020203 / CcI3) TaxID=106370 RepID=UPI001F2B9E7D|nr:hypothetical protein [Frankia casuarinae]